MYKWYYGKPEPFREVCAGPHGQLFRWTCFLKDNNKNVIAENQAKNNIYKKNCFFFITIIFKSTAIPGSVFVSWNSLLSIAKIDQYLFFMVKVWAQLFKASLA